MKAKAGGTILGLLFIFAAICKEGGGHYIWDALWWMRQGFNWICMAVLWVWDSVVWVIHNFHNWF